MSDARDHSSLKWIKAELDSSLDTARHALEAYVDEDGPETELDSCISHIHQVRGTLQLIQLYGGAMLAEEMELVAQALKGLGEQKRKESAEALMVGLAQLPGYLENIESGASDTPLLLLPLMNELRAARDASLLSEVALFSPSLDQKLKPADGSEEQNPELPKVARKLRYQYHKALLDWYRDIDAEGGLARIAELFKALESGAGTTQIKQFFQVAQAAVVALHDGSLDSGIATKLLVGKIDREIKRIIDEGELAVAEAPANDLIKNLLYYTACADSSSPIVQQVKQAFDLDKGLFSQSAQGGQDGLHAPGRELLDSLRSAIGADLTAIKDQLDLFIRSKSEDLGRLQAQQEPLKKLADTLGMVGQGELRNRLMRQADKVAELVAADTYPDERDLMAMASDILFIETSLDNLSVVRRYAQEDQGDQVSSSLPAGEFERLVDSVMHEAGIDMARNKEAILNYIEQPDNKSLLQDVPRRFNGIAGAFSVLNLSDAADLMGRLNRYVENTLLGVQEVPVVADLDVFADAVTGIEYFMEAVTEGRGIHPEILDVTRDALSQLGVPDTISQEIIETVDDDELEAPVTAELESEPAQTEQQTVEVQTPEVRTPSAEKPALEDIDPEILEIFIEEAEEELAAIAEYLPRWCDNRDDREALTTFRRSFHTLKGSGRLVGARFIGEYAWSLENLLNRVIDETVEVSPAILDLLKESITVLPVLIESQKQGTVPEIDVQPLIERAEALAKPGAAKTELPKEESITASEEVDSVSSENLLDDLENEISADEALSFSVAGNDQELDQLDEVVQTAVGEIASDEMIDEVLELDEEHELAEETAPPAPIIMDETLLEIFEAESQTHIETLSNFHSSCSNNPLACRIDRDIVRALHTLHGSAEMAGVDSIAQVSTALESMTSLLNGLGKPADTAALELIDRSVVQFKSILDAINVQGGELPDWRELIDDIHQYRRDPDLIPDEEEDESLEESLVDEGVLPVIDVELDTLDDALVESAQDQNADEELASLDEAFDLSEPDETQADSAAPVSEIDELTEDLGHEEDAEIDIELDEIIELDEPVPVEIDLPEEATEPSTTLVEHDDEQAEKVLADDEVGVEVLSASGQVLEVVEPVVESIPSPESPVMVELEGDPELVDIFLEEARELHEALEGTLQSGGFNLADKQISEELQRTLHTLKGGARLAGAMPIGDLSHGFESLLTAVDQGRIQTGEALTSLTHEVLDLLAEQIDDLGHGPQLRSATDLVHKLDQWLKQGGEPIPEEEPETAEETVDAGSEIIPTVEVDPVVTETEDTFEPASSFAETVSEPNIVDGSSLAVAGENDAASAPQDVPLPEEDIPSADARISLLTDESGAAQSVGRGQREQVRVRSDLLDRLVNYAGEVSIYRTRIEQQNGQLGFNLTELEQTISRLREQLRQLEIETEAQILFRYEQDRGDEASHDAAFDPLELDRFSAMQQVSRSLMETVNDLANINGFLEDLQSDTDTLLLQQSRITTDLQDGLMRTRMVPFAQIVPRLHRVVRQTCNQLNKKAELLIQGEGSEIDRGILERMIGPLEHILRNAIAHGIETPEQRRKSGKNELGKIRLLLSREGSDIQLVISDDGAGVNMPKIREQAIKSGLLDPNADVADADVLPFVLEHGFSTAQEITQIAGRGVGLDVVVSEVKQLGGALDITSQSGEGAKFIIRLPLTLAITDALLVELCGEIYSIPHTSIEGVVRVSLQELEACYSGQQSVYNYAGQDYQVRYLGTMLNVGQVNLSDQRKWYPLLLVRAGDHHVALQVDGLLGNRQIVVKSVGVQVSTVRWISGGTILGDGRVALILDVTALVRSDAAQTAAPHPEVAKVDVAAPEPGVGRTVMVVDDSITVRKVTGRLLERHGMNVITAKDGVDAVATLQEQRPDIMLLDIEMPRMDGYELARHMRNSKELKAIPIIMITSRTGEKHRNLAMELGVRRYLGKPYQESELLDNIYSVLDEVAR